MSAPDLTPNDQACAMSLAAVLDKVQNVCSNEVFLVPEENSTTTTKDTLYSDNVSSSKDVLETLLSNVVNEENNDKDNEMAQEIGQGNNSFMIDLTGEDPDDVVTDDCKIVNETPRKIDTKVYRVESSSSSDNDDSSSSSTFDLSSTDDSDILLDGVHRKKNLPPRPYVVKTKGEFTLDDLPPIEDLQITVLEKEMDLIGKVYAMVEQLVVVQSLKDIKPLDLDSVLFLNPNNPLGKIFDVFGPVIQPFYSIRFNSAEHIREKGIEVDADVFYAPEKNEITKYVFINNLRTDKGSDASWKNNNEPPDDMLDYSDDEKEKAAKHKRKAKSRAPPGGAENDGRSTTPAKMTSSCKIIETSNATVWRATPKHLFRSSSLTSLSERPPSANPTQVPFNASYGNTQPSQLPTYQTPPQRPNPFMLQQQQGYFKTPLMSPQPPSANIIMRPQFARASSPMYAPMAVMNPQPMSYVQYSSPMVRSPSPFSPSQSYRPPPPPPPPQYAMFQPSVKYHQPAVFPPSAQRFQPMGQFPSLGTRQMMELSPRVSGVSQSSLATSQPAGLYSSSFRFQPAEQYQPPAPQHQEVAAETSEASALTPPPLPPFIIPRRTQPRRPPSNSPIPQVPSRAVPSSQSPKFPVSFPPMQMIHNQPPVMYQQPQVYQNFPPQQVYNRYTTMPPMVQHQQYFQTPMVVQQQPCFAPSGQFQNGPVQQVAPYQSVPQWVPPPNVPLTVQIPNPGPTE